MAWYGGGPAVAHDLLGDVSDDHVPEAGSPRCGQDDDIHPTGRPNDTLMRVTQLDARVDTGLQSPWNGLLDDAIELAAGQSEEGLGIQVARHPRWGKVRDGGGRNDDVQHENPPARDDERGRRSQCVGGVLREGVRHEDASKLTEPRISDVAPAPL